MKKVLFAAAIALVYTTAFAGMYHAGADNICADCHTMHASMAHDFNGAAPASTAPKAFGDGSWLPNQDSPQDHLLKGTKTGVCVACHDGLNWAPDVVGANANAYVRSAGFIPATAGNGHTMGYSGNAPGTGGAGINFTTTNFTCADCHSPHGKADAFRNLNQATLFPGGTGYPTFYLGAALAGTSDARINATYTTGAPTPALFTQHIPYYSNANVFYENGDVSKLDLYCGKCHGNFHNNGTDLATDTNQRNPSAFKRHPTRVAVTDAAGGGYTTKVYVTSGGTYVGCLSCHKAHGTANPFGLFYATAAVLGGPNTLDNSESGTSGKFGGACSNCHGEAR